MGWRLVCISLLPICTKTLVIDIFIFSVIVIKKVYGSPDGGETVYNSSSTMNQIIREVGKKLNLKEHKVKGISIFGPVDCGN